MFPLPQGVVIDSLHPGTVFLWALHVLVVIPVGVIPVEEHVPAVDGDLEGKFKFSLLYRSRKYRCRPPKET
jgi:hypothetical protein